MNLVCLDLEGVLIPEIWKGLARLTEIDALNRTTRDEPDYDVLMRYRLEILDQYGIGMNEVRKVVATMDPIDGAKTFLDWLRSKCQVIILSDTFYEFAEPLIAKLGYPTIFCHSLVIGDDGSIKDYQLRQQDQKRIAVENFKKMNFTITASGDSYNDMSMLGAADKGVLYCPPDSIIQEFPQYPVTNDYIGLATEISKAIGVEAPKSL